MSSMYIPINEDNYDRSTLYQIPKLNTRIHIEKGLLTTLSLVHQRTTTMTRFCLQSKRYYNHIGHSIFTQQHQSNTATENSKHLLDSLSTRFFQAFHLSKQWFVLLDLCSVLQIVVCSIVLISFGHCIVCPFSIYGISLPLWCLQTCLTRLQF